MAINREGLKEIARNTKAGDKDSIANAITEAYQLGRTDGYEEARDFAIETLEIHMKELKRELEWENIRNRIMYGW